MDMPKHNCLLRSFPVFVFFLVIFGLDVLPAHACTLWAAAGEKTVNGGAVLAKNRDWFPENTEMRIIVPKSGFTYLGLFPVKDGKAREVAAGINQKGLALVNASADSVPKNMRNVGAKHVNETILSTCDSVDAVLKKREIFSKSQPLFYMVADRTKIALIEAAPRRELSIKIIENGILYHTNHYISENLLWANKFADIGSTVRLDRIKQLLTAYPLPITREDFIAFSEDTNGGPDNSIWRKGSGPKKERTLATWIAYIPQNGNPEVFVKLANPGEHEKIYTLLLDEPFWTEGIE